MEHTTEVNKAFATDILSGLRQSPKRLPSKYFYDAEGDRLFQRIMALDEYYLTRAEMEIIKSHKSKILQSFLGQDESFRLIELGAGDGTKTKVLLEHFVNEKTDFVYSPIDISQGVLNQLEEGVMAAIPELKMESIQGDYFQALGALNANHLQKEVVMFLGSTIGNFGVQAGEDFLKELGKNLSSGDLLFIGFDLMKDPATVLAAYNDKEGVTKAFNLNLLKRINEELEADFDTTKFQHYPTYDPVTGETKSYLVSTEAQQVYFKAIDYTLNLRQWEPIHMEVSQKYSFEMIEEFAETAGFKIVRHFTDDSKLFVDSLLEKEC